MLILCMPLEFRVAACLARGFRVEALVDNYFPLNGMRKGI